MFDNAALYHCLRCNIYTFYLLPTSHEKRSGKTDRLALNFANKCYFPKWFLSVNIHAIIKMRRFKINGVISHSLML